jgi:MOSC domain-containing protein YiiM
MNQKFQGKVRSVFVMEPENAPLSSPREEVEVTWGGFAGDKHAGLTMIAGHGNKSYKRGTEIRNTRQVSLVAIEELREVAENMNLPEVQPAWIGANLCIEGIPDLTALPPGARLIFSSGAGLVVEEENTPCTSAGQGVQDQYPGRSGLAQLFPKAALRKRGLVAWVERPGHIRAGDSVQVKMP